MAEAHSQRAHAKRAPSAASRWMRCGGSVALSAGIEETPSTFAAEGTAAHMLAERCLATGFDAERFKGRAVHTGKPGATPVQFGWPVDGHTVFLVDGEMVDAVQIYLDVVRELQAESDELEIETKLDMSALVPGVFGTGDVIAYVQKHTVSGLRRVTIVDLKYGKGVAVDVEANEQELTYAVGVVARYHNRGVDEVELVIVQPRAPHRDGPVRRWVTDVVGLYEHVFAMQAALDDASFTPGVKQCNFCKAAGCCDALATRAMELAMGDPLRAFGDWSSEQDQINLVKIWAKRREEFAHAEAIRGRMPPGAKLVGKRAIRKFRDDNEAVSTLQLLGVEDDVLFETSLRSPAQIEKELPKAVRSALDGLVIKASSGTVLALLSDPRSAVDPNDSSGFEVQGEVASD